MSHNFFSLFSKSDGDFLFRQAILFKDIFPLCLRSFQTKSDFPPRKKTKKLLTIDDFVADSEGYIFVKEMKKLNIPLFYRFIGDSILFETGANRGEMIFEDITIYQMPTSNEHVFITAGEGYRFDADPAINNIAESDPPSDWIIVSKDSLKNYSWSNYLQVAYPD